MWPWINENAPALSVFAGIGTILFWALFSQFLLMSIRRSRTPRLRIQQTEGQTLESICVLANMGHAPVYVRSVAVTLETGTGSYETDVTDLEKADVAEQAQINGASRQGPMQASTYMGTDRFGTLIERVAHDCNLAIDPDAPVASLDLRALRVRTIVNHGPEHRLFGFERVFVIVVEDSEVRVRPRTMDARSLSRRSANRILARLVETP